MACATLKRSFDLLTSPPHNNQAKRRRCGAFHGQSPASSPAPISPFSDATPRVCPDELTHNVQEEWRRIQRRRRLPSPDMSSSTLFPLNSDCSPASGSSRETTTHQESSPGALMSTMLYQLPGASPTRRDQPLFTVKQVVMLCERLWKEREEKLREEYDKVLNNRLAEQYDSFLKFTQDQIMRRYQQAACSYVS